jgi:hypothetical protein
MVRTIYDYRKVWPGFENESIVYGFVKPSKHLVIFGLTHEEMRRSGVPFNTCQESSTNNEVFVIQEAPSPANGLYDLFFPEIGETVNSIMLLAFAAKKVVLSIQIPNRYGLPSKSVAAIAIHESFHGVYQINSGKFIIDNPQPRDFLEGCRNVQIWNQSVVKQNQSLVNFIKNPQNAKIALETSEFIRSERKSLEKDPLARACLSAQRFWERIEGTAHFVQTASSIEAGFLDFPALQEMYELKLNGPKISDGFFYLSGDLLIRLLIWNGVKDWSYKIDQGIIIDELL